jgi:hypothetical protein
LEWWLVPFYVGPVGLGAPNLAASLGPGPVEDALRNYERVTGRKVLHDGIKVDPVISPTLGGGTVGLAGRF